jgi:hypothetical protein
MVIKNNNKSEFVYKFNFAEPSQILKAGYFDVIRAQNPDLHNTFSLSWESATHWVFIKL